MPDSDKPTGDGPAPRPSDAVPSRPSSIPRERPKAANPPANPSAPGRWADLGTRLASALIMLAVAIAALWVGGLVWTLLVAVVTVLMGWELARLCDPGIAPRRSALLAASLAVPVVFLAAAFLTGADGQVVRLYQYASWGVMLLPVVLGLVLLRGGTWIWVAYGLVIQFGAQFFLFTGLDPWGFEWLLAVVGIVILSDTFGYFAGRVIGGPKFWPRISPKKTWSGTVAGWIAAAIFAGFWMGQLLDSVPLAVVSGILIAFCGQMGDIAASAIKRRVGVKDASNLIPGHGGFMDRLDAMIAAAAATIVFALVF
ncbi:MAG: phosphatidate cytidylyltransferase [Maritimibacter sp.]|nr:phosphatidate cytidylyltransferase [Maritimibacter sp.]